jgi:hypothetical protein
VSISKISFQIEILVDHWRTKTDALHQSGENELRLTIYAVIANLIKFGSPFSGSAGHE